MKKYLLLFAMLIPSFAFAIGEQYGRITGIVYGPQGAELPGAKLVLTSKALIGGPRAVVSSTDGSFTFNTLASGSYDLKVTSPQMKTYTQSGIAVSVGKTFSLYIALEAGDPASIVAIEPIAPEPDPDMTSGGFPVPDATIFGSDRTSNLFPTTVHAIGDQQFGVVGIDGGDDFYGTLQKLPKQSQSLEEFIVLLPTMQEAKGSVLYAGQPVQVVEDGFLWPSSQKAHR